MDAKSFLSAVLDNPELDSRITRDYGERPINLESCLGILQKMADIFSAEGIRPQDDELDYMRRKFKAFAQFSSRPGQNYDREWEKYHGLLKELGIDPYEDLKKVEGDKLSRKSGNRSYAPSLRTRLGGAKPLH